MAESVELVTQSREGSGSRAARALRRQGLIPAVLYGHQEETLSIALPREPIERAIRHGVHVVSLKTNGNAQKALIRDLQWDFLGKELLHIDFYRIREGERVQVTVSFELRGIAPGATTGVVEQPLHQVQIECPADSIPENIRVNIGQLQLGQSIKVKDLTLPEGVKVLAEPDALVVHVVAKEEEKEAAPAAPTAEGAAAEPERIGRQKPVEEEEK